MPFEEPRFQIGICPNCPQEAEQRFLFTSQSRYGPVPAEGRIVAYEQVDTLSLFQCERCRTHLVYLTQADPPSGISIEDLSQSPPDEIAELDPDSFLGISTLVWPTKTLV